MLVVLFAHVWIACEHPQSVYELLEMFVGAKKIKHVPGSSLIVRVCDGRRSSEILSALQIEQDYMPKDKDGATHALQVVLHMECLLFLKIFGVHFAPQTQ